MSQENVKRFYEALAKDRELQEKFNVSGQHYKVQNLSEAEMDSLYEKEVLPAAKKAGFDFTLADLKAFAADNRPSGLKELSEEELAAVAGGCGCAFLGGGADGDKACSCFSSGTGVNGSYQSICKCEFFGVG